jgi:hypothetical protein
VSAGNNTVEVDPAALMAEAERAIAGALPADDAAPAPGEMPADAGAVPAIESWRPTIAGLTPMVRMTVFAQWNIQPAAEGEFINALADSLDMLFPGGPGGKWAPLVRLLGAAGVIVFMNYSANGGKLPPLGLKKPDAAKPAAEQRAAA